MSVMERECQLKVERKSPKTSKFPVIDIHTHFGKLFGAMINDEHYFDRYAIEETVDEIKSYGVKKVVNLDGGYGDEYRRMMDKIHGFEDFIINFGQVNVEHFPKSRL